MLLAHEIRYIEEKGNSVVGQYRVTSELIESEEYDKHIDRLKRRAMEFKLSKPRVIRRKKPLFASGEPVDEITLGWALQWSI